jgi:C4-dicarboxylate-specific signal transduction histidine kinase
VTSRSAVALSPAETKVQQQFISDVFHALSQPLTALRCSLELALMQQPGTLPGYRAALQDALHSAERLSNCAEFLRGMAEAEDPGTPQDIDLNGCLNEAVEEFAPVFEYAGRRVSVDARKTMRVVADPAKLQRALFLLLDFCAAADRDVLLDVKSPGRLEIRLSDPHGGPAAPGGERAKQSLALAERMFTAMGASMETIHAASGEQLTIAWQTDEAK